MIHKKLISCLIAIMSFGFGTVCFADQQDENSMQEIVDPEEMEVFFGELINTQLKEFNIAGAAVSIVKDGEILFSEGYGFSDVLEKKLVDENSTLFRMASISKTFTATGIMQLVERNKISLTDDINNYFENYKIPDTYEKPITILNLLNHTSGLEDGVLGYLGAIDPTHFQRPGQFFQNHPRARVRPAGQFSAYTNFNAVLAGHVIETASGLLFDEYMERNILEPLNMKNSTFVEPLPDHLAPEMSKGYRFSEGEFVEGFFELTHNVGPASSLTSSVKDMANYMIAQLNYNGESAILQSSTLKKMHSQSFTHDQKIGGLAHGFMELDVNGHHFIYHSGGTLFFQTLMVLYPERNLGFMVAYNTESSISGMEDTFVPFVKKFFPRTSPRKEALTATEEELLQYAGEYRAGSHTYSDFEKVFDLGGETILAVGEDGLLNRITNKTTNWEKIGKDLYIEKGSDRKMAFKRNDKGEVTHYYTDMYPDDYFYRLRWFETTTTHLIIWLITAVCSIFILLKAVINKFRKKSKDISIVENRMSLFTLAVAVNVILFFVLSIVFMATLNIDVLLFRIPLLLYTALTFPLLIIPFYAVSVILLFRAFKSNIGTLFSRSFYAIYFVLIIGFLWSLNFWNVLGYNFG